MLLNIRIKLSQVMLISLLLLKPKLQRAVFRSLLSILDYCYLHFVLANVKSSC